MINLSIDFRSDTVTRPTPGMKAAMMAAPLGDDVFGEDPTVNALEQKAAALFGMEAGLFCPSGTMTNQLALKVHTQPGDEIICDELSHIYQYEGGGIGFNCGCSAKLLRGHRGLLNAALLQGSVNNPADVHKPLSRLLSIENTMNRGGGACYDWKDLEEMGAFARQHGLGYHLDGARLFNALIARNQSATDYGKLFDSISICLSKGLGAPVGSVLLGSAAFIQRARRFRKVFGGGMRQAGVLAAAGIYALDNHVERLATDHLHAKMLAGALEKHSGVKQVLPPETNILMVETEAPAAEWVAKLAAENILCIAIEPHWLRFVTHLDLSESGIGQTIEVVGRL